MLRTISRGLMAVVVPGVLSGCGVMQQVSDGTSSVMHSIFCKQVKQLHLDLNARAALNTKAAEMSALSVPTLVRIYQLRDRESVDRATYQQLLSESRATLGADLVNELQVVVRPGEGEQLSAPLAEDARYVAVIGLFRSPDAEQGTWRLVIERDELDPDLPRRIELGENVLQLKPVVDEGWW